MDLSGLRQQLLTDLAAYYQKLDRKIQESRPEDAIRILTHDEHAYITYYRDGLFEEIRFVLFDYLRAVSGDVLQARSLARDFVAGFPVPLVERIAVQPSGEIMGVRPLKSQQPTRLSRRSRVRRRAKSRTIVRSALTAGVIGSLLAWQGRGFAALLTGLLGLAIPMLILQWSRHDPPVSQGGLLSRRVASTHLDATAFLQRREMAVVAFLDRILTDVEVRAAELANSSRLCPEDGTQEPPIRRPAAG